jgi:glycosyltransferase involved in cell wall biosynthesis
MKIAILTPYLPYPPHAGGRIRMLETLRFLCARHDILLISFTSREVDPSHIEAISHYCSKLILLSKEKRPFPHDDTLPLRIAEFQSLEMQRLLSTLNKEHSINLVHIEHIFMAQYISYIEAPCVLHEHNIESKVMKRYAELSPYYDMIHSVSAAYPSAIHFRNAQTEWLKLYNYETAMWPRFPLRITVSDRDRMEMLRRCAVGRTVTIPNGINTQEFTPIANLSTNIGVLFIGAMDYQPNVDAVFELCDKIWPLVQQEVPDATLYIVGRKIPAVLLAKQKKGFIEMISDAPNISPYASRCCLSIVPLRVGGGTRIKILTAMALGLPVVSTTIGCEGLDVVNGTNILIADEPEDIARCIRNVLFDKAQRLKLSKNGRSLVEESYDWQNILPQLESLYNEIATY